MKRLYRFPDLSYLHIGCGDIRLPGFLNTDCFLNHEVDLNIDVRFPLPLESGKWKGIYAHHALEHISHSDACRFFQEAKRLLVPGGTLRIVVPDGGKILDLYAKHTDDGDKKIFELYPPWHRQPEHKTPMEVVNKLFRDTKHNPHHYAWDFRTLEYRLLEAGFDRVLLRNINMSEDSMLANRDTPDWDNHSLYVEAFTSAERNVA